MANWWRRERRYTSALRSDLDAVFCNAPCQHRKIPQDEEPKKNMVNNVARRSEPGYEFREDLGRRLREAGMPEEEVTKLMGALMEFWQKGGSIDDLGQDQAVLKRWGLRPDSLLLVKIILDARRMKTVQKRGAGGRSMQGKQQMKQPPQVKAPARQQEKDLRQQQHFFQEEAILFPRPAQSSTNQEEEEEIHYLSQTPKTDVMRPETDDDEEEDHYAPDFEVDEEVDDGEVNMATAVFSPGTVGPNTRVWAAPAQPPEPPIATPPIHRWYPDQSVNMSTESTLSHTQKAFCYTPDEKARSRSRPWQQASTNGSRPIINEPRHAHSPERQHMERGLRASRPQPLGDSQFFSGTPPRNNNSLANNQRPQLVRENSQSSRLSHQARDMLSTAIENNNGNTTLASPDRTRTAKHIINGQWKLGKCIGQGSFGAVYTCMDEATGQLMAVKMMALPMFSESVVPQHNEKRRRNPAHSALRDLCSEIGLMRSFDHPNIVRYLGATVDESSLQLYIFQEWIPGGSISTLSEHYGPFAESVVRRYTCHILRGLEYLHSNQIIHRDIKCGNVLVDEAGVAKLADFGASHRLGCDGTLTNDMKMQTMRGTPYFMAPEVLQQDKFGRRSDVWSVGGVVLQMATTDPPWKILNFGNPMALFCHIIQCESAPPTTTYNLSPMLRSFINRCFIRDPARRPHAYELLRDPFSTGEVIVETQHDALDDTLTRIERVATPASASRTRRRQHQNSLVSPSPSSNSMSSFQPAALLSS